MHRGEKLLRPALRRGLADVCGSAKPIMSFAVLVQTHSKARAKQGGGGCKVVGDARRWRAQCCPRVLSLSLWVSPVCCLPSFVPEPYFSSRLAGSHAEECCLSNTPSCVSPGLFVSF